MRKLKKDSIEFKKEKKIKKIIKNKKEHKINLKMTKENI